MITWSCAREHKIYPRGRIEKTGVHTCILINISPVSLIITLDKSRVVAGISRGPRKLFLSGTVCSQLTTLFQGIVIS